MLFAAAFCSQPNTNLRFCRIRPHAFLTSLSLGCQGLAIDTVTVTVLGLSLGHVDPLKRCVWNCQTDGVKRIL